VLPPPARNKGPYPKVTARSPGSALRTQDRSRQARVHSRTSDLGARYPSPPEVGHATPYRPTDSVHSNVAVVAGSVALSDSPSRRPPPAAALRPPRPLPRPLLPCPAGPALRFPGGGSRAGRVCPGGGPVRVRGGSCVGARSRPRSPQLLCPHECPHRWSTGSSDHLDAIRPELSPSRSAPCRGGRRVGRPALKASRSSGAGLGSQSRQMLKSSHDFDSESSWLPK